MRLLQFSFKRTCFAYMCLLLLINTSLHSQDVQGRMLTGPGVTILNIDADRPIGKISEGVYGHFLEHINHSVVDGLYAEQVRGCGFEGKEFATFWKPYDDGGSATAVETDTRNGNRCLRLMADKGSAGIRQERFYLEAGQSYNGSVWVKNVEGSLRLTMRLRDSTGKLLKEIPLRARGREWEEVPYSFVSSKTDTKATMEIEAKGGGTLFIDYISLITAC